ncbi:hypothetical protein CRG98_003851 [Punica granatum]|uniref:Uncharacterized protein n=1 Tax=Punica granatum TaxID=22663 RepID=A0A2I0L4Z1_PUNGR|nr:hypothetical protein CRG98_003851 [Punica granatum]
MEFESRNRSSRFTGPRDKRDHTSHRFGPHGELAITIRKFGVLHTPRPGRLIGPRLLGRKQVVTKPSHAYLSCVPREVTLTLNPNGPVTFAKLAAQTRPSYLLDLEEVKPVAFTLVASQSRTSFSDETEVFNLTGASGASHSNLINLSVEAESDGITGGEWSLSLRLDQSDGSDWRRVELVAPSLPVALSGKSQLHGPSWCKQVAILSGPCRSYRLTADPVARFIAIEHLSKEPKFGEALHDECHLRLNTFAYKETKRKSTTVIPKQYEPVSTERGKQPKWRGKDYLIFLLKNGAVIETPHLRHLALVGGGPLTFTTRLSEAR